MLIILPLKVVTQITITGIQCSLLLKQWSSKHGKEKVHIFKNRLVGDLLEWLVD